MLTKHWTRGILPLNAVAFHLSQYFTSHGHTPVALIADAILTRPLFFTVFYRNLPYINEFRYDFRLVSRPMSPHGCPGQHCSRISTLPGQKIPIPRPPGGDYAYVAAAEKIQTFRNHNSGVFAPQELILGVLSTPDTSSFTWYG